jgi:hypothetical protein
VPISLRPARHQAPRNVNQSGYQQLDDHDSWGVVRVPATWRCATCGEVFEFDRVDALAEHEEWHRIAAKSATRRM